MKKLRIAQIGTIWETTPPKLYGGTERVLHDLTEELVKKGHDVTLFATGDSKTSAKLSSTYPRAAYRDGIPWENTIYPLDHITRVFERANEFDIIHAHFNVPQDAIAFAMAGLVKTPVVTTIHMSLDKLKSDEKLFIGLKDFLLRYKDRHFVSISNAQRTLDLNFADTVYNGLDFSKYELPKKAGKHLVWIGRFVDDKGPKEAIMAAKKAKLPLILAGKVDYLAEDSRRYFTQHIEPHIDGKMVKYIGEVNDAQKRELLRKAKAFLMPIKWNEPFGLTMIEAMAMGVPVIAFNIGSVPEIVLDGKTGFIVKNVKHMADALKKVDTLNRSLIAQYAKNHFSAETMANGYLKVYESLIRTKQLELNRWMYALEKTNA
jgi:glycosyltransferase involved in cell wall biosynthesis